MRDQPEFSARRWPDWSFWDEPRAHRGRIVAIVVNGVAALGLLVRAVAVARGGYGAVLATVVIGLLAGYALAWLLALWFAPSARPRRRIAVVAGVFVLGCAPAALLGSPDALTDLTYAVAIGFMLLPLRWSVALGLVAALAQIGWMRLALGYVEWGEVAALVGVTAFLGIVLALTFTIGHLRLAREQVRAMAVHQERDRVARDLHDILGHTLSTMTIKLGLAERALSRAGDVDLALGELRDLDALSRQALADVRATVSGYRAVTLDAELAGARLALRAAGVRADLPTATEAVHPELRGVFGYVVREAVTNVLRHSDAGDCRIRLGPDWVEITDNGSGTPGTAAGNGLTGLAERLSTVDGNLEHGPVGTGGFRVVARGPVAA